MSGSFPSRPLDARGEIYSSFLLKTITDTGDRRILEMSQAMSMLAGETLIEKMEEEGLKMKPTDLTKIFAGATNQVAAKQRWSHSRDPGGSSIGMSMLAQMLQGKKLTIEDKSPGDDAVDVTPTSDTSNRETSQS